MPGKPAPLADRFWQKVNKQSGTACWLWTGARSLQTGYGSISVQVSTRCHRNILAHRVAWELTHGPIPPGMFVCHLCDNPPCVRPDHLVLGTHAANLFDARQKGRMATVRGERNGQAKLTSDDIVTIATLRGTMPQKAIAARFGIHQAHVKDIQLGKRWGHIERPVALPQTPAQTAAKLTIEQVQSIRALRGLHPQRVIAQQFHISQQQVSRIHTGNNWREPLANTAADPQGD